MCVCVCWCDATVGSFSVDSAPSKPHRAHTIPPTSCTLINLPFARTRMDETILKDRRGSGSGSGSGEGAPQPSNTPTPTSTSTSTPTSINNLAEDAQVRHTPSDHGYAKIVGEEFSHVLREKKLQIGRIMPIPKPGLLGISQSERGKGPLIQQDGWKQYIKRILSNHSLTLLNLFDTSLLFSSLLFSLFD